MALLRFFTMLVWVLVFIVLLLFAAKNVETVTLRFYLDHAWDAPLIVVFLTAFAAGALFGLIACLPSLVRQRRDIIGLKRELRIRDKAAANLRASGTPIPASAAAVDLPPTMV